MADRDLTVRIDADASGFEQGSRAAIAASRRLERELQRAARSSAADQNHLAGIRARYEAEQAAAAEAQASAMEDLGKQAAISGAALAAGIGLAVAAAVQWESAWAGVLKTADTDDPLQLAALEEDLRGLARTLPATQGEIAAVAEAAGQLGISTPDVAAFTRVMIDLGETTNLSADEAATSLAQMMNVMQTAPAEVGRLGAALVALGNNGASTEAEIMEMALRISGAGKQVGLAESDVLAMSNALASLGINAEAGGSAISVFMSGIAVDVATGSTDLEQFADVAGMTVVEFSRLFKDDAAAAVGAFTDGLGRIQEAGGSAIATLEDMGIKEIRQRDLLLRLAGAQGILADSLALGRDAYAANNALLDEANTRYDTTEAKMQVAKNAVNDLAIGLGSTLLPALAASAEGIGNLATFFGKLPGPLKTALMFLASLSATVMIVGGAALLAQPKIAALQGRLLALGLTAGATSRIMTTLSVAMKGLGLAGAFAGAFFAVDQLVKAMADAPSTVNEFRDSLADFAKSGAITGAMARAVGQDFSMLAENLDRAGQNKAFSLDFGTTGADIQEAREQLDGLDDALAGLVTGGQGDLAAQIFGQMSAEVERSGGSVEDLRARFDTYADTLLGVQATEKEAANSNSTLASGLEDTAEVAGAAYSSLQAYGEALGYTEDGMKELLDQVEAWGDAFAGFIGPLEAYTGLLSEKEAAEQKTAEATAAATESSSDSWEDYATDVAVSVADYLAVLEEQVAAQEDWSANMLALSSRVSQGTLDELARMGPEGAPLVAQLVDASDEELARLETVYGARTAGATGAMAEQLLLAQPVLTAIARTAGQSVADGVASEIAAGTTTVAAAAARYGVSVYGGIVPPVQRANAEVKSLSRGLEGLDGRNVSFTVQTRYTSTGTPGASTPRVVGVGGGFQAKAEGGFVSGPGTGTSDSIPALLSNGEYVIRAASVAKIGKGALDSINRYASGGIVGYANGGQVSATNTASLTTAVRGMDLGNIEAIVAQWKAYNDQLEQAARRQDLVSGVAQARRELAIAKGTEERARAQESLNDANKSVRDFDFAAARDAEASAVERMVDAMERQIALNREANALRRETEDNKFDLGAMGSRDYLAILKRRMDDEERYSNEWTSLYKQRISIIKDEADALSDARDKALDTLNGMLDAEASVRARQVQAEATYYTRRSALAQQFNADQQRILDQRRDSLTSWARLDEVSSPVWGNTVEQLVANAGSQLAQMDEWMAELDAARTRGVSEQVIASLGLDEGPQALGALRQFNLATVGEIEALNAAVGQRTSLASEQVAREQRNSYGALGRELTDARQRFADEVAALDAEFIADQQEMTRELAEIGATQGRTYGQALADGLRSELANVQAAARALAAASGGASSSSSTTTPGVAPGPFRSSVGRTVASGGGGSTVVESHTYVMLDGKVIDQRVTQTLGQQRTSSSIAGVWR